MQIGLLGILGIVFIVLKLCSVIAWSWWLVLLPFYIGFVVWLGLLLLSGALIGTANVLDNRKRKRK